MLRAANLLLKFLLELAAFTAFAFWGANTGEVPFSIFLAVLAPAIAIVAWGIFAAPKSGRRLRAATRIPFELGVFALAVIATFVAGEQAAAIVLAILVAVNAVLLTALDQWEA